MNILFDPDRKERLYSKGWVDVSGMLISGDEIIDYSVSGEMSKCGAFNLIELDSEVILEKYKDGIRFVNEDMDIELEFIFQFKDLFKFKKT